MFWRTGGTAAGLLGAPLENAFGNSGKTGGQGRASKILFLFTPYEPHRRGINAVQHLLGQDPRGREAQRRRQSVSFLGRHLRLPTAHRMRAGLGARAPAARARSSRRLHRTATVMRPGNRTPLMGGVGRKCLPEGHERLSAQPVERCCRRGNDLLGERLHITLKL